MMRCAHQLRVVAGLNGVTVVGFDMTSVLGMAAALAVPASVVATFGPVIEAGMVEARNSGDAPYQDDEDEE